MSKKREAPKPPPTEKFLDKRGRTWEWFSDPSYYDMICVRCLDVPKDFNSPLSFHFGKMEQIEAFIELMKEAY